MKNRFNQFTKPVVFCYKNKYLKSALSIILVGFSVFSLFIGTARAQDSTTGIQKSAIKRNIAAQIPSLDELASDWKTLDELELLPSIHNFNGQLMVNKDLASISWLASPPYSQGFHSGVLKINGQMPLAGKFRWFPYQTIRAGSMDGLAIETVNRMVFDSHGVLWRISVSNTQTTAQSGRISVDLIGNISKLTAPDSWDWSYAQPGPGKPKHRFEEIEIIRDNLPPRPENAADYQATLSKSGYLLQISDATTPARTAFAFARKPDTLKSDGQQGVATWNFHLAAGETQTIEFVMAYGEGDQVAATAARWAKRFNTTFADAKKLWAQRYEDAFTPHNSFFEGNLPVLKTDDPALRRNYYMGAVTMLLMLRDQLPGSPRVFSAGGPRWGSSIEFIWDLGLVSNVFALLEPKVMKAHLITALGWDLDKYFAFDYYAKRPSGYQYVASYPLLFRLVSTYLRVTGDSAFLNEKVGERTCLEQLDRLALNYQKYVRPESGLADFGGDPNNFLECVPTYIHATAGFNAAYVGMLRQMAELYDGLGRQDLATQRRAEADKLVASMRRLYVTGKGYWQSRYPDGQQVDIRHCLDFQFVVQNIAQDLSPTIRREMRDFVVRELLTKNWMRAQSLQDPAAAYSVRPDHGPVGAYSGWPPETADCLCHLGYWQDAIDFYRRCESVTHEGAFSQGHVFYGPKSRDYDAPVRIAKGLNCREALCGADFTDVMIRTFFGFHPDFSGKSLLLEPDQARGFTGELRYVRYKGALYTLRSDKQGIHMEKE